MIGSALAQQRAQEQAAQQWFYQAIHQYYREKGGNVLEVHYNPRTGKSKVLVEFPTRVPRVERRR